MLIRHAAVYMVSNVTTAVLGFTCAAVFTRLFTPADYGVYLVANSVGGDPVGRCSTPGCGSQRAAPGGSDARRPTSARPRFGGYAASSGAARRGLCRCCCWCLVGLSWPEAVGACTVRGDSIALFEMQLEMLRAKGHGEALRARHGGCAALLMLLLGIAFNRMGFGGFGLSLSHRARLPRWEAPCSPRPCGAARSPASSRPSRQDADAVATACQRR